MKFSKRMEYFGESVFTTLAKMKQEKEAAGERVIDFSIGAPNIPPADHILEAMKEAVLDKGNYIYAISDLKELDEAVAGWYERRYGVEIDPKTEVVSLLGSQEGLSHIALSIVDPGGTGSGSLLPGFCGRTGSGGGKASLYAAEKRK